MNKKVLNLFSFLIFYINFFAQQKIEIIDTSYNIIHHYQAKVKSGDTIKCGYYYGYLNNGKLFIEGSFKRNKKVGVWKRYQENGNVFFMANFKKGLLNGKYIEYYENQKISEIGYYQKGIKTNKWLTFNEKGDTLSIGFYSGKLVKLESNDSLLFVFKNNKRKSDTLNVLPLYSNGIRNSEPFNTYGHFNMQEIHLKKGIWYYFDEKRSMNKKEVYDKNGVIVESEPFKNKNKIQPPTLK